MSKTNTHENDYLLLMLNNTAMTLVGDAAGILPSAVAGSLYWSLHTADPGEAATQLTSEITYTSYARVAAARTSAVFSVSGNVGSVVADVLFPAGTGGAGTATHWGLGASSSGTGKLIWKGPISPTIVCGIGVQPKLTAGSVVTED